MSIPDYDANNDPLLSERHLSDIYMEYVKATVNINNQQKRIQFIVQKALDNGINISDFNHFVYKKDYGLLYYCNSMQSSYLAVQVKFNPPSFSKTMDKLLKQDYSYKDVKDFFEQLNTDANGFLKELPKLDEEIDLAIGNKHWSYNKPQKLQDSEIENADEHEL